MKNFSLFCFLVVISLKTFSQAGVLDSSFGGTGIITTQAGNDVDEANAVVVQPDGKIVAAGYAWDGNNFQTALVRYLSSGTRDSTFAINGILHSGTGIASAIILQPTGNMITAGSTYGGQSDFVLRRITPHGEMDTSYHATINFGYDDFCTGIAVQADGKIVVCGFADTWNYDSVAVARLDLNGEPDSSFSGDGKLLLGFSSGCRASGIVIQPDGKIVLSVSITSGQFAVVRLNEDGSLDSSFSNDGYDLFSPSSGMNRCYAIALLQDSTIVLAGSADTLMIPHITLVKYLPDGSLDTSFGSGGVSFSEHSNSIAYAMTVQPDHKIIVTGWIEAWGSGDFITARYLSNGTVDSLFGSSGMVITTLATGSDKAAAVALQPDGKIMVAGTYENGTDYDFAVVRYLNDLYVGIPKPEKENISFSVFPNPSSGDFTVTVAESIKGKIEIYSAMGEKLFSDIIEGFENRFNVHLTSGIFIVRVSTSKHYNSRILVIH